MRKEGTSPAITPAYFEFLVSLEEQFRVAREYARLHAIGGVVDLAQSLIEILVRLNCDDRAENFLTVHFHVGLCAGEDSWLDDAVSAAASAQQSSTGADGLVDPGGGADRVDFRG